MKKPNGKRQDPQAPWNLAANLVRRGLQLKEHDLALLRSVSRGFEGRGARVIAGVDEAGRGPLAGPVVACAAIVKDFDFSSRIDDSKKLTPLMRERAYSEILEKCRVSIALVDHNRIDEINILRATLEAAREAVRGLPEKPNLILMDGVVAPDADCEVRCMAGGDGISLSIACASIVAKVVRDRLMRLYHERYPEYRFDVHKGYGTAAHLEALARLGPCEIHRQSFAPVRIALHG